MFSLFGFVNPTDQFVCPRNGLVDCRKDGLLVVFLVVDGLPVCALGYCGKNAAEMDGQSGKRGCWQTRT